MPPARPRPRSPGGPFSRAGGPCAAVEGGGAAARRRVGRWWVRGGEPAGGDARGGGGPGGGSDGWGGRGGWGGGRGRSRRPAELLGHECAHGRRVYLHGHAVNRRRQVGPSGR